ncbi:MAG: hypothetical protein EOO77_34715 [Oxalobacteraceae bacterium]|nr:MAG: hypothetical protein EOO77_34715 [Oxalobacteraceae bacterium]
MIEGQQRAMVMATRLYDYRGQPMAQWFAALPWLDRVRAFTVAHEAAKDAIDAANAVLRQHNEEAAALRARTITNAPAGLREMLDLAIR